MNEVGINVGFRIIKYYFWQQFLFKYQVKKAKQDRSYQELSNSLKEYDGKSYQVMGQPLSKCNFTIFDLETTGFFPEIGDEIISIGAVKFKNGKVKSEETFYQVINPLQRVSQDTKKFTGLKKRDFLKGVPFPIGFERFLNFSRGSILVAHPASFDINFLQARSRKWGLPPFKPIYLDSFALAKALFQDNKCYLDDLIKRLGIERRKRHHALNDAMMTAEIFELLLAESIKYDYGTLNLLQNFIDEKTGL
ncbi:DNA polymerase-3 subunit epsilon [Bacillus pakistanensis]|uniref:DNA polymerase-3 subunit epsilon n=1 Tax=Rossellomorea pakistanensis TaxID=992288 RepID=A0ABS2N889_9BACI|nr:3'-5' exonuclease [Bacillus pakistanensis]MBM7584077.1 DNA polymerase-3 subunit epsilon [Bacillus pakistanensis]